jgi:cystathionine gamma-synthase
MNNSSGKNSLPSLATLFAQADGAIDPQTGGIVPPIQPSSTFTRGRDYKLISEGHIYGRDDNDLLRLGEEILTKAEHGEDGLLFPSGMAATAAVMRTIANGGKILLQSGIYWGTTKWVREFCERRAIELQEVDCSDSELLRQTIEAFAPNLVFVETPSNPWLKIVDINAASQACAKFGAILIVDSTAATPVLSNPLDFGADIVMHSATKAINGHSDLLAGFLAVKDASLPIWQAIITDRHDAGALLGSFEAWLLIRGMRTLPLRVERMSETSQKIAEYLEAHEKVDNVLYPGLPSHPMHDLAKRQMNGGFGSLMSILVKGDGSTALAVCGRLNLFKRATSLGGVESLVEHRHSIEEAISPNLIRLSVGIENANELIADLEQALG